MKRAIRLLVFGTICLCLWPPLLVTAHRFQESISAMAGEQECVVAWRSLAEQGQVRAQYNLGEAYFKGFSVAKDFEEAAGWYRKAAEQGYALAQYQLGAMYTFGVGVPQNDVKAYAWLTAAATLDPWTPDGIISIPDAVRSVKRTYLAARMTPAEVTAAQKLSHKYQEAYVVLFRTARATALPVPQPVLNEHDKEARRLIFYLYYAGNYDWREIALRLNAGGLSAPQGGAWRGEQVHQLARRIVMGLMTCDGMAVEAAGAN